ncbi:MAG: NAD-dependent epimerase/dehydratase family protein [Bacteroidota bacterium]|nr:NAD-dependent epimerase/dehydratase family protein [Candidatus Kapabacteria bacterium]MDW8219614.1 NAD-dependent epimerase/dehydratase family protein [Bacteroidota bacterium]
MIVFVTGATGFVGSFVAEEFLRRGYTVRCLTRATSSLQWLEGLPVERAVGSLLDKNSLERAVSGVDVIVHVAGLTAARNREEFFQANHLGTKNLLEAARAAAPHLRRFVHLSSLTVCGPAQSLDRPLLESDPCKPLTAYGESKKAAEDEVNSMRSVMPITIIRAPAVYGQRDTAIFDYFKAVNWGIAALIGFDDKRLSLIHVEDLARGLADAAESPTTIGETYFVADEPFYSWVEITSVTKAALQKRYVVTLRVPHSIVLGAAALSEFVGKFSSKPPVFNYEKGIDFIQKYWICSVEKAHRDFGYTSQLGIECGIPKTIAWYKENKWL